jgi:hypothetical protein
MPLGGRYEEAAAVPSGGPLTRMGRVAVLAMLVSMGEAFLLPPHTTACVQLGQFKRGSLAFARHVPAQTSLARPQTSQTSLARPLRTLLQQSEEPLAEGGKLEKAEPPLVATSKYTPEEAEKIGNLVADDEWMGLTVPPLPLCLSASLCRCVAVSVCRCVPCRRVAVLLRRFYPLVSVSLCQQNSLPPCSSSGWPH